MVTIFLILMGNDMDLRHRTERHIEYTFYIIAPT